MRSSSEQSQCRVMGLITPSSKDWHQRKSTLSKVLYSSFHFPDVWQARGGEQSRIWSDVWSWKLLVSFSVWNSWEGNSATVSSLCMRALGNDHVLSTKQSFPFFWQRSLGGHVVWFISLICQQRNGKHSSSGTHTHSHVAESPHGCSSCGF